MRDKRKILVAVIAIVVIACIGFYFFVKYQSYHYVEATTVYKNTSTDNANYKRCLEGVLRYSRDGIALLTDTGEELWNQPCQMNTPIVETCGESIAVGDKGGTSILVLQRKGLKGEIHTTKPIERFAVSSQGIVSAILKDDELPLVMCYDAMGNKLIEHKVQTKSMGYPMDVSVSPDGKTLLVSYLYTEGNEVVSKVIYYYFGQTEETDNYQIYEKEFSDTVIPIATFLNSDSSLLVTDHSIVLFRGLQSIEEVAQIELKTEIQSVAYDEELIAVVVRKADSTDYTLNIYDTRGKMLSTIDIDKEYECIKASESQIILYEEQHCNIYMKKGVRKFEGNVEQNIMEIFPMSGLNKYMVINADGFHEIRLVK